MRRRERRDVEQPLSPGWLVDRDARGRLGYAVGLVRERRGLSREALALRGGLSASAVGAAEHARVSVTLATARGLARALGVEVGLLTAAFLGSPEAEPELARALRDGSRNVDPGAFSAGAGTVGLRGLAETLVVLRAEATPRALGLREVAVAASLRLQSVVALERGTARRPLLETLARIAWVLGGCRDDVRETSRILRVLMQVFAGELTAETIARTGAFS